MIGRSQRFIIWLLASFLVSSLFYKGHCFRRPRPGQTVAFRSLSTAGTTVRIKGDVLSPGIYRLPDDATVRTVINMTPPSSRAFYAWGVGEDVLLQPGMILDLKINGQKSYSISVGYMGAKERMMLRIPLDLQKMQEEDWESLPGIGPKTAADISAIRQKNGGFSSPDELMQVPGISERRLEKIRPFFSRR